MVRIARVGRAGRECEGITRSVILILTLFVFVGMGLNLSHLSHLPHLARERNSQIKSKKRVDIRRESRVRRSNKAKGEKLGTSGEKGKRLSERKSD